MASHFREDTYFGDGDEWDSEEYFDDPSLQDGEASNLDTYILPSDDTLIGTTDLTFKPGVFKEAASDFAAIASVVTGIEPSLVNTSLEKAHLSDPDHKVPPPSTVMTSVRFPGSDRKLYIETICDHPLGLENIEQLIELIDAQLSACTPVAVYLKRGESDFQVGIIPQGGWILVTGYEREYDETSDSYSTVAVYIVDPLSPDEEVCVWSPEEFVEQLVSSDESPLGVQAFSLIDASKAV